MADFWLLLLLAVSAVWVLRAWRARRLGSKARKAATYTYPPGLEPYPLIGHLPQFLANRHRVLDWMTEAFERQPTCTFVLRRPGGVRGAITANPANVEHFLRGSFDNYPKGPRFASLLHDFLGRGIFNADGEAWRAQRKVASHEFNTRSLRAFVALCVHAELHGRLLPLLRRAAASGARLDLQDVLERFAFDNICRVAFDHDPRQLTDGGDGGFADAFRDAANLSAGRFRYAVPGFWKIKKALNVGVRAAAARVHRHGARLRRSHNPVSPGGDAEGRLREARPPVAVHGEPGRDLLRVRGAPPRRRDQLPTGRAGDHVLGAHLVLLAALLESRRAAPHPRRGRRGARPAGTGRRRRRLRPGRASRDELCARGHH
ncbi:cytochrome P450 94B3-like [Panicum miliaceum]|uniref:Cytochrome P450 94B3-like n=1 Tax=Panicum miliaceum TaxID=4540 RepID=A0A3L6SE25_PANMI|nr:cytochrome P450 94B3-like [Panicum miliaceum]